MNHVLIEQGELFHSGVSPLPALRLGSSGDAEMSTVLIVDAFPAVRKALRRLLERQLCSVDAIAKTEVSRPDLIILDLCMPEMNGFEAARVLRETMPQIPILMFTSHDSPAVESKAASVGIRAVFSKYAGITALVAQASALLSLSR